MGEISNVRTQVLQLSKFISSVYGEIRTQIYFVLLPQFINNPVTSRIHYNMTKSKVAKFAAGFVGFALALSFVVTPVTSSAQTTAELTAMINSLLAQIAQLQAQVGSSGGSMMSHTFNVDLTVGSTGADVTALQQFLVSKGFLTMPAGVAMGNFGPLTQSALAAYQASVGISPASGYFGPVTRANVNSKMGDSMSGGTTGGSTSTGGLSGSAGDITVTSKSSGTDDQVLEGEDGIKVLGFEIDPDGSDVSVSSVRVELKQTDSSGSKRLERYVDSVSIMQGSKVVGTADASDFTKSSNVYSKNISISKATVRENDKSQFYVAINAVNNIDSDDISKDWTVGIGQIRFEDATGAILTNTDASGWNDSDFNEVFTFEDLSTAGDVELTVNEDDQSVNDAHTVKVDDTSDTNDVEVLSFTVQADGTDMLLNSMAFDVTSSAAGVTEIANDFRLMMDGDEVGTAHVYSGVAQSGGTCSGSDVGFGSTTDTAVCVLVDDLDDDDVSVSEGDEISFTLLADINDTGGAFVNGSMFSSVTLDADNIDAEDSNGDAVSDLSGSADATNISFSATGINLASGDSDSVVDVPGLDTTTTDDQGQFTINFEVTAFDKVAYIALTAASSTSATPSTAGAYAYVESVNADDTALGTGTTTLSLERVSGGTLDGNYVKINPGQTAKLRLTVYHDAATTGVYRAQLHAVNFNDTKAAGDTQQLAQPTSDYQSPSTQIKN